MKRARRKTINAKEVRQARVSRNFDGSVTLEVRNRFDWEKGAVTFKGIVPRHMLYTLIRDLWGVVLQEERVIGSIRTALEKQPEDKS